MTRDELKNLIVKELSKGISLRGSWFVNHNVSDEECDSILIEMEIEGIITYDSYLGRPDIGSVRLAR